MEKRIVIAKPGSGKTTYIVSAINAAIGAGVPPNEIYAVTFTRDAAREMRTRISDASVHVSTIHSLAYSYLQGADDQEIPPLTYYDTLLEHAIELLKMGPTIPFSMLAVDEAQDLNGLQYEFLKLIVDVTPRVVIVGDPNQSIFSFQRSDPKYMTMLGEGMELLEMPRSYRIPSKITGYLDDVFSESYHIIPDRKGGMVRVVETDQKDINQMVKGHALDRYGTTAIIFRTNREIASFISSVVRKTDYNYVLPVSEHPTVALATVILTRDTDIEPELFSTVAEFLGHGSWEVRKNLRILKHLYLRGERLTITKLEHLYGGGDEFMTSDVPLITPRVKTVMRSLVDTIKCICPDQAGPITYDSITAVVKAINDMGYVYPEGMDVTEDAVVEAIRKKVFTHGEHYFTIDNGAPTTVMTVHASKGQEFDNVIHVMNPYLDSDHPEEFRILYVALTRAKDSLTVILPKRTGSSKKLSGTTMFDAVEQSVGII